MSEPQNTASDLDQSDNLRLRRVELSSKHVGWMIMIISALSGIIAIIIVSSVTIIALNGGIVPDVLANWGGIILGFYFGQFVSLVKDYMGVMEGRN